MKFGVCTSLDRAATLKAQGWDFVEENVQRFFQPELEDSQWHGDVLIEQSPLPLYAANSLVPAGLKIVGPDVDFAALERHMTRVIGRAPCSVLVFGSGAARNVPEGFDRNVARQQIIDFAKMSGNLAMIYGLDVVCEHLRRQECNIINTIDEAMSIVRDVDKNHFKCLVDSYHLWSENESLDHVRYAIESIAHVHVADLENRVAPGLSGKSDYRELFSILKRSDYKGAISVEASDFDIDRDGAKVLSYLNQQWSEAT